MKLGEFLENENCKFIKIGTCGTSFLYCGSLKNLDTKKVDRSYRKFLRKKRKEHLDNMTRYQSQGIMTKADRINWRGRYITVDEYVKLKIDQEKKYFEKYEKKIKDYKPIAKREIKEVYQSALYRDCVIVIIAGFEHGNIDDL